LGISPELLRISLGFLFVSPRVVEDLSGFLLKILRRNPGDIRISSELLRISLGFSLEISGFPQSC